MNEIFKRVSVRNFTEQKVEEEKLQQILKAAMQAPSAGNQMPWEFYVVTDKAKIEELSQCSPYAGCAANAPAVIVPCYRTEDLKFPEFDQIDTAIATEHILLESVSLGLGAVLLAIAPIEERMKKAKKVLGIGKNCVPFALVPLGYPQYDQKQKSRFNESRIHWVK